MLCIREKLQGFAFRHDEKLNVIKNGKMKGGRTLPYSKMASMPPKAKTLLIASSMTDNRG
jgi:hypothetical protein